MPDSAYRHSVELHRMVWNSYSVSIWWVVKTVQCSLPMWFLTAFDKKDEAREFLEPLP